MHCLLSWNNIKKNQFHLDLRFSINNLKKYRRIFFFVQPKYKKNCSRFLFHSRYSKSNELYTVDLAPNASVFDHRLRSCKATLAPRAESLRIRGEVEVTVKHSWYNIVLLIMTNQIGKSTWIISQVTSKPNQQTHVTGFNVKLSFGLELFFPRIFFCSSLMRFSCSLRIFWRSSSIFRCSSTIASLSSA